MIYWTKIGARLTCSAEALCIYTIFHCEVPNGQTADHLDARATVNKPKWDKASCCLGMWTLSCGGHPLDWPAKFYDHSALIQKGGKELDRLRVWEQQMGVLCISHKAGAAD